MILFIRQITAKWILKPFNQLIHTGLGPSKLSLTLALGACLGMAPFPGTTITCTVVALFLGLNIGAIQVINYMVYPLQLLLLYPLFRLATYFSHQTSMTESISGFIGHLKLDWAGTLSSLGLVAAIATLIWGLISIPLGIFIYKFSLPLFSKWMNGKNDTSQKII